MLYLEAAGQPIVVLNTATAAHDLLDKREYSERPHLVRRCHPPCVHVYLTLIR